MSLPLLFPRPLKPGGVIGLVSPSGPTTDPETAFPKAVAALEARGYRVKVGPHAGDSAAADGKPYLAGADADRVGDLNALLRDPSVDLILCARGGYGAMRLLDRIDYDAARRDPKPLVGYSDVTALSLALLARAGVVSYSGIMATAGHGFGQETLDPFSEASFFAAVAEGASPRVLTSGDDAEPWTVHRAPAGGGGTVTGPLIPVCFSLLVSLVGTPYLPDLTGAVLVIEDIHEELYAIDRFLTTMRLAGLLDRLAGVLIGSFNGTTDQDEALVREVPRLVTEMTPDSVAVASGVPYGHIRRRLTLPVGAPTTVDLAARTFTFPA